MYNFKNTTLVFFIYSIILVIELKKIQIKEIEINFKYKDIFKNLIKYIKNNQKYYKPA